MINLELIREVSIWIGSAGGAFYAATQLNSLRSKAAVAQDSPSPVPVPIPLVVNGDRQELRDALELFTKTDQKHQREITILTTQIGLEAMRCEELEGKVEVLERKVKRLERLSDTA